MNSDTAQPPTPGPTRVSLWQHPDFLKLWSAQTISLFGSSITFLALPLIAVVTLDATPAQMGLLGATQYLPYLLLTLLAGVWVDRLRRRPILIATDLGRAALLAFIATAIAVQRLQIEHLYVVAFLLNTLTMLFDVAYMAFIPSLVDREQLVEGNSKLEASRALTEISGRPLAGGLIQAFTAPIAIGLDILSFLVSALFLRFIRTRELHASPLEVHATLLVEIREGVRLVIHQPLLRAVVGAASIFLFFDVALEVVYLLYVTRELAVEPVLLGIIFGATSVGSLIATLVSGRLVKHFGLGLTLIGSLFLASVTRLFIPLAESLPATAVPLSLIAAEFFRGFGLLVYTVNAVSLRQTLAPPHLQGRVNATARFFAWGPLPLGTLLGGMLGEIIGLQSTLLVGVLGMLLSALWLTVSPVRSLRHHPVPLEIPVEADYDRG